MSAEETSAASSWHSVSCHLMLFILGKFARQVAVKAGPAIRAWALLMRLGSDVVWERACLCSALNEVRPQETLGANTLH